MTAAEAFAKGLQLDPISWKIGQADGARRAPWRPPEGADQLAYASGYLDGERFGCSCCEGNQGVEQCSVRQ